MNTDVIVIGAGPNGLMLACELALAGVRTTVLEAMPGPSEQPKANGVVGQAALVLDRRGLYEKLAEDAGPPRPSPAFMFAAMPLNLSMLGDENPLYGLPVPQQRLVAALIERALELGAEVRWSHEVVAVSGSEDAVSVRVNGPHGPDRLTAAYVVGADGAHSPTRKQSGIDFPGVSYDRTTSRVANVEVPDSWRDQESGGLTVPGHGVIPPFLGLRTQHGLFNFAPFPGRAALIATTEWDEPESGAPMTLTEMRQSVARVLGSEIPLTEPTGPGPYVLRRRHGGSNRLADRFRAGRLFLLGDAAHVDAAGGQGLNLGLQDAVNLGWKLATAVRGTAPSGLLDSYHTERRLAAERVLLYAHAINALLAPGEDVTALRTLFGELLNDRDTVLRLAELTAGTDIRYEMGVDSPHRLVGRFVPDLTLRIGERRTRLAELSRNGRPLLLDLTAEQAFAAVFAGSHDRLDVVSAVAVDSAPASALLIRPDGYTAWATDASWPGLDEREAMHAAAARWFGMRMPSSFDAAAESGTAGRGEVS